MNQYYKSGSRISPKYCIDPRAPKPDQVFYGDVDGQPTLYRVLSVSCSGVCYRREGTAYTYTTNRLHLNNSKYVCTDRGTTVTLEALALDMNNAPAPKAQRHILIAGYKLHVGDTLYHETLDRVRVISKIEGAVVHIARLDGTLSGSYTINGMNAGQAYYTATEDGHLVNLNDLKPSTRPTFKPLLKKWGAGVGLGSAGGDLCILNGCTIRQGARIRYWPPGSLAQVWTVSGLRSAADTPDLVLRSNDGKSKYVSMLRVCNEIGWEVQQTLNLCWVALCNPARTTLHSSIATSAVATTINTETKTEENHMKALTNPIERKTLLNGLCIDDYADSQLLQEATKMQARISELEAGDYKSSRVDRHILELRAAARLAIDTLDGRTSAEKSSN